MATLRQQIATNVLTVTRFRELMKKLRENRPNDDLELVKKPTTSLRSTMPARAAHQASLILSTRWKLPMCLPT